jgi:hypothetical protein
MEISPNLAKTMIKELYSTLKEPDTKALELFRRSFALNYEDLKKLLSSVENPDDKETKLRIYPALTKDETGSYLTLVLMLEDHGKMIWNSDEPDTAQNAIQDQMMPCPVNCPGIADLFTEKEWESMTE